MARNLDNINKQRLANGLAPLEKLPSDGDGGAPAGAGSDTPPADPVESPVQDTPPGPSSAPPAADTELDDSRILEALRQRGITVTDLKDLVTPEDPAQKEEKRQVAKLSYSLGKGLFSLKEHEAYIRERDNPRDLVFAEYHRDRKEDDPALTDEDIQSEFEEKYAINADPNSRKFKAGAREIGILADHLLRSRYKKIYDAEGTYASYESQEAEKVNRNRTIVAKAPSYKRTVEEVFTGFKKISIPLSETETYEVDIPDDMLAPIKALFLDPDTCSRQILDGYTPEKLRQVAYTTLLNQNFAKIFELGAQQYALARQKGTKGIPSIGPQGKQPARQLSENQKKVLADNGIKEEDLPPVGVN